jgi:hypothetical protein
MSESNQTKPSDYAPHQPCCSIFGKTEHEVIAQEVVKIMGDEWRPVFLTEFQAAHPRGYMASMPSQFIESVLSKLTSEEDAIAFSPFWRGLHRRLTEQGGRDD